MAWGHFVCKYFFTNALYTVIWPTTQCVCVCVWVSVCECVCECVWVCGCGWVVLCHFEKSQNQFYVGCKWKMFAQIFFIIKHFDIFDINFNNKRWCLFHHSQSLSIKYFALAVTYKHILFQYPCSIYMPKVVVLGTSDFDKYPETKQ